MFSMGRRLLVGVAMAVASGCGREPAEVERGPEQPTAVESAFPDLTRARLKELYDRARQAGEIVPDDVMEWARTDASRIGDWEYRLLSLADQPDAVIQQQLQSLGSNRWECFWVEATPDGRRFYFKRPQRSYLQLAGSAAKFVPLPSGNNP